MKTARIAIALFLSLSALATGAQDAYPSKPVKIVVPFVPGGTSELLARVLAKSMSEGFGQSVIIENIGGAGSTLGSAAVAKAAPDGYTLLFGYSSGLAIAPGLYDNLPYDSLTSFTPIGTVAGFHMLFVAHPDLPVNSLQDLVAHAKRNPGKLTFGSPGVGSTIHLAGEMLKKQAGVDMVHVPYKGMRPALLDLIAGRINFAIDATDALTPLIKEGRLKPLAATSRKRLRDYPNVPTVAEAGYPELEMFVWTALVGPAGMPPAVTARVHKELARALASDGVQKRFTDRGYEVYPGTPADLTALLKTEIPRWREIVRASGAKAN